VCAKGLKETRGCCVINKKTTTQQAFFQWQKFFIRQLAKIENLFFFKHQQSNFFLVGFQGEGLGKICCTHSSRFRKKTTFPLNFYNAAFYYIISVSFLNLKGRY